MGGFVFYLSSLKVYNVPVKPLREPFTEIHHRRRFRWPEADQHFVSLVGNHRVPQAPFTAPVRVKHFPRDGAGITNAMRNVLLRVEAIIGAELKVRLFRVLPVAVVAPLPGSAYLLIRKEVEGRCCVLLHYFLCFF